MTHYKDISNNLHFLEDMRFEYLLPSGCTPITDDEATELRRPTPDEAKAQAHAETIAHIVALEATQPRAVREATLTGDKTRLQAIEDQIAELRTKLV